MLRNIYLCVTFLGVYMIALNAQRNPEIIDSRALLLSASEAMEEETYHTALKALNKIGENDTNYAVSLVQKVIAYYNLEVYDKAIEICNIGLQLQSEEENTFYLNRAACYDLMQQYDKAIAGLDEALDIYPNDVRLMYKKAAILSDAKRYEDALAYTKQIVQFSPAYPEGHLLLGQIVAREGKIVEALLSLSTYLILSPESSKSLGVLAFMENVATGKNEISSKGLQLSEMGDGFGDVEAILKNQIALEKGYKTGCKFTYPIVRQLHVMLSQIEYNDADKGFWMQYYLPIYKKIYNEARFNDFIYYIFLSSQNSSDQAIIKKQEDKIVDFIKWIVPIWVNTHKQVEIDIRGEHKTLAATFANNLKISAANEEENDIVKYKYFFNEAGQIIREGAFDDDLLETGVWKWYDKSGRLTDKVSFEKGKREGVYTLYHKNGKVKEQGQHKEDIVEGDIITYHANGEKSLSYTIENERLEGLIRTYHPNGQLETESIAEKGKRNGSFKSYYPTGQLKYTCTLKDDLINGEATLYYIKGNKEAVKSYKDGLLDGKTTSWHINKKLATEGQYENDKSVGIWKHYDQSGQLIEDEMLVASGKNGLNRVYFDNGKVFSEIIYKNSRITSYVFYTPSGDILIEQGITKSILPIKTYYQDGTLSIEGIMKKGKREGIWKYYDIYGQVKTENTYKEDILLEKKEYYPNEQIKSITKYKDGLYEGYFIGYHPNGMIAYEGNGVKGKVEGDYFKYNTKGALTEHLYFVNNQKKGYQNQYTKGADLYYRYYTEEGKELKTQRFFLEPEASQEVELLEGTGLFEMTHPTTNEPRVRSNMVEGINEGKYALYYDNGQLEYEATYLDDKLHGEARRYYNDGTLEYSRHYLYGMQHGTYIIYHPNGAVKAQRMYEYGEQTSYKLYYRNGALEREQEYKYGLRNGSFRFYAPDGTLMISRIYKDDKLIAYTYIGEDGKELPWIPIKNGTANIVAYYPNGKKSAEYSIKNGWFEGAYYRYDTDGSILFEGNFLHDESEGKYIRYAYNHKPIEELNYVQGERDGTQIAYYINGQVREKSNYYLGLQDGLTIYYDKSGKETRRTHFFGDIPVKTPQ